MTKISKNILFITQKIHQDDDDLAFVILWIKEFIRHGFDVKVICLEKGNFDDSFQVYSLGKECGSSKLFMMLRFFRLIIGLKYDRVFVHMNPEYITLGGLWWFIKRIPIYLWYTHYTIHFHLWLSGLLCKRLFAATEQSLPQYTGSHKKIITQHGIDVDYWLPKGLVSSNPGRVGEFDLLSVHRISRSKRLEISIKTLEFLPSKYRLFIYGRQIDEAYYLELKKLIVDKKLGGRVFFLGPVPMSELKRIYPNYRLMINMASETIDKTMLEGMLFGVYPVTTRGNARAIGLEIFPELETPQSLARFILSKKWQEYRKDDLISLVKKRHSLTNLIDKLSKYIEYGN